MAAAESSSLRPRWAGRHRRPIPPWEGLVIGAVALVQLGGTALAARHQPDRGGLGVAGFILLALAVAVLPVRWYAPRAALSGTLAATAAYWSLGYPRGPVFAALIVAFAHTLVRGDRRAAVTSLLIGFLVFPWLGYVIGRADRPALTGILGLGAWLITLLSIAEVIRSRRERAREASRSREEALQRRSADERMRIARELHDAVAHNMSLINIQAGVALHVSVTHPEQTRAALQIIKQASKDALVELRSILGVLRQADDGAPLGPTPSLRRVDELVAMAALSGITVALDVDGRIDDLPRHVDLAAYRIVQESLTNVARHSAVHEATVRIRATDGALRIEVLDKGAGRRSQADLPSGGNGLVGMHERAAAVGGTVRAGPRPGRGFAVTAELPLHQEPR